MTYRNAVRYLNSLYNYEKQPNSKVRFFNLDRIKILTGLFGNPQNFYPCVHITGTKGKGSVASIVSSILSEAGFKTGLYTSPHLIETRERLKINNIDIGKNRLTELVAEAKQKIKRLGKSFKPSFFEVYTLLAFNYFRKENVDIAIFEVGMGGSLDATNVVSPLSCGITSISYDHTKELGNSLGRIAGEKAGIIKKGVYCIAAPQQKSALDVIRKKCKKLNAKLLLVGKDIKYKSVSHSDKFEKLNIKGISGTYNGINLPLVGEHQLVNCAVSVGIIEALILKGYRIPNKSIFKGIKKTSWPGRIEIISKTPKVIIDGSHNRASARALARTIKRNFKYNKLILILGVLKDKDVRGICEELDRIARRIILTRPDSPRAVQPKNMKKYLKSKNIILADCAKEAYEISRNIASKDDIILVTGSMYLIGEFKQLLN